MFLIVFVDRQRTDYTICGTCNSRGDQVIITVDVRQHRPMSDRLVANGKPSAKSVSMPDKYTHMIVWTTNLDVLVLEI